MPGTIIKRQEPSVQMRATLVRGNDGRRMLAVQLEADVDPQAENVFSIVAELRRLRAGDPRATPALADLPSDGWWEREVSLRHLRGPASHNGTTEVAVLNLQEPGQGHTDIGLRVLPGANPLPFLVDLTGVPPGSYLFTVGSRTVRLDLPNE